MDLSFKTQANIITGMQQTILAERIERMIEMEDKCVCCGRIIPEGLQVCPQCNAQANSYRRTGIQRAVLDQITSHYTYDQQRDVAVEECAEFIQAAQKCKRYTSPSDYADATQHLREEVADVLIMVEQMRIYLGTDQVDKIINAKLQRQLDRIAAEMAVKYDDLS